LSFSEVSELYASGSPGSAQQYPFSDSFLTLNINSSRNETTNINGTAEIEGKGNYTIIDGSVETDIELNETGANYNIKFWNLTENNRPYFNKTINSVFFNETEFNKTYSVDPYTKVTTKDVDTDTELSNFNVTYDSNTYESNNSKVFLPSYNESITVTAKKTNYFDNTTTYDSTNDITLTLDQKEYFIVTAKNTYSDASINSFSVLLDSTNFYTSTGTINTSLLSNDAPGTYNITFYNISNSFNRSYENYTIDTNLEGEIFPFTVINATDYQGNNINNFTLEYINQNDPSDSDTISTTTGQVNVPIQPGTTYTLEIRPEIYEYANTTLSPLNYTESYTFTGLLKERSLYITFKDTFTTNIIDDRTIYLDLISEPFAQSYNTTNGTLDIELLTPADYQARYTTEGYDTNRYIFSVTEGAADNVSLYLANSSLTTEITFTVFDYGGEIVPDITVKSLRYNTDTNSYYIVEATNTNSDGQTIHHLDQSEFYKFIVSDDSETYLITSPQYILTSSIDLVIDTGQTQLTTFNDDYINLDYSLTYNETTNDVIYTYNNIENLAVSTCLKVYTIDSGKQTLLNNQCSTAYSNTLSYTVSDPNSTTYMAKVTYENSQGDDLFIDQIIFGASAASSGIAAKVIIFQVLLTLLMLGIAMVGGPELAVMSIPLSVIIGRLIGLNSLPWYSIFVFMVVMIILSYIVFKRR